MPQKASLDLRVQFSLAVSFISSKCYSTSVKSNSVSTSPPAMQPTDYRDFRVKGGPGGLTPAASWLCQPAPPPSQPVVNCSSALTFAFSTEILILHLSKTTSSAFELHRNLTNARNHFHIWKTYSLLSRMAEIQVKYSPYNITWTLRWPM